MTGTGLADLSPTDALAHNATQLFEGQGMPPLSDKDCFGIGLWFGVLGPPLLQVATYPMQSPGSYRHQSILSALAATDHEQAAFRVD